MKAMLARLYADLKLESKKATTGISFNLGQNGADMQAYDTTFEDLVFPFPAFHAKYTVELSAGSNKDLRGDIPADSDCSERKWAI